MHKDHKETIILRLIIIVLSAYFHTLQTERKQKKKEEYAYTPRIYHTVKFDIF